MSHYPPWVTLRQLDEAAGAPKGSAFRLFKRRLTRLNEGSDFIVLDPQTMPELAAQLDAAGALYRSSIHPVLLAPTVASELARELAPTLANRK